MRGNSLLVQDVKAALWARVIYWSQFASKNYAL
jgi:hypothetical protein